MTLAHAGRPDLFVVARFIERLQQPGPWTRSRLQRAVGLNYDIFRRYLDLLLERGHIERDPAASTETYRLTARGERLGRDLVAWLRDVFDVGLR